MSPIRNNAGSRTEIRLGVRAHLNTINNAHAPPRHGVAATDHDPARLDADDRHR
jgi:hypothetical protein